MDAKLAIIAQNRERTLPEDASISVEMSNPIFNNTEMFSYPINLPLEGNRDMLKNIDAIDSDLRPISLEHTPMRIMVDGVPFASGPMVISENERLESGLSLNIDSAIQDFSSMIGDLSCNEVPIPEEDKPSLVIGEKIANVKVSATYDFKVRLHTKESGASSSTERTMTVSFPEESVENTFEPQALGFSYPAKCAIKENSQIQEAKLDVQKVFNDGTKVNVPLVEQSYINVTDEYLGNKRESSLGSAKFCNARICYAHHDIADDGTTSNDIVQYDKANSNSNAAPEDHGPLWVLEADRPQSGICFYVLYFLECLFKHLNMNYDIEVLKDIEDMKHLLFFTTKCAYETKPLHGSEKEIDPETGAVTKEAQYFFNKNVPASNISHLFDDVNTWLSSRGCGGQLVLEDIEGADLSEISIKHFNEYVTYKAGVDFQEIKVIPTLKSASMHANIVQMIATGDNFPNMSVSSLLSSLENMFGIKFSYDYEQNKVTAYLIRNVLRNQSAPRTFHADIFNMVKMTEKITGVRVGYSTESDAKEQRDNVKNGVRDYNTNYDYISYPDPITGGNYRTVYDKRYSDFFRTEATEGNYKVYIDMYTGNAFRVKINGDATEYKDMKPRFFEVGGYKGVEEGDCSTINEDFVIEMLSDLEPIIFTDANFRREVNYWEGEKTGTDDQGNTVVAQSINNTDKQSLLCAFIDEDMEHEFVEQRIRQNLASAYVNLYFTEKLKLVESYDPTGTDDGNSPLQSYDWGNAIAMMRGSGSDSVIEQYDTNYDGFGSNKWMMTNGKYALASDTMDQFGIPYDYNGVQEGIGSGERFSLKPRAYKQPEWADSPLCISDSAVRDRGYVDTFLKEYIYFLLNRKKFLVECYASVAQIADIPNHWKDWWIINNKKCLINKVNTDISMKNGMQKVELEIYAL